MTRLRDVTSGCNASPGPRTRRKDVREPVVAAKVLAPSLPPSVVARPQLVERLERSADKRLALLVAPAGYGKSVLLGQWSRSPTSRRIAWLTVDQDDDGSRFGEHLCAALRTVDARPRSDLLPLLDPDRRRLGDAFVAALAADLLDAPPLTIVLDDFHSLREPDLVADIGTLLDRAPRHVQFVISSRMDPALRYQRFRLRDELAVLRQDDLAFAPPDVRTLVCSIAGRELTRHQLDALLERTEGWTAGLQLAALSLVHVADVDEFIERFAGDDGYVADYLTEQVLANQPTAVRRFLLLTSVLDRLGAGVCDAVVGGRGSQEMLEVLERRSLFTNALEPRRQWFRYHRLFRDLLRQHLREAGGDERGALRRAAEWHADHGDLDTAFEYLERAGDWRGVIDQTSARAYAAYSNGQLQSIVRGLERVPATVRRDDIDVALLDAAVHALTGDSDGSWRTLDRFSRRGLPRATRRVVDVVRSCAAHDGADPRQVIAAADRVLRSSATERAPVPSVLGVTDHEGVRKVALVNKGAAYVQLGEDEVARDALTAARGLDHGGATWDCYASGYLALLDGWQGAFRCAQQHAARALVVAAQPDHATHPSTAVACLALAHVARERGRPDEASSLLDAALVRLQNQPLAVPMGLYAVERGLLALSTGDAEGGLSALAQQRSRRSSLPPAIQVRVAIAEARLRLATGDLAGARESVARVEVPHAEVRGIEVHIAAEEDDVRRARRVLDDWPTSRSERDALEQAVWTCVVLDLEGHRATAQQHMAALMSWAQEEGHVRLFADAGGDCLRLMRAVYHERPTPFARQFADPTLTRSRERANAGLIDRLSERELAVLHYLPGKLSNSEIAADLQVSVNTLKTHLKHIYRKLGVNGRTDAISAAERMRLL